MYFESLSAALAMNGHGGFVWGAYAMTVVVLSFLIALPARRKKQYLRDIGSELRRGGIGRGVSIEGAPDAAKGGHS